MEVCSRCISLIRCLLQKGVVFAVVDCCVGVRGILSYRCIALLLSSAWFVGYLIVQIQWTHIVRALPSQTLWRMVVGAEVVSVVGAEVVSSIFLSFFV